MALVRANRAALAARSGGLAATLERGEAERQFEEDALREAESAAAAEDTALKESLAATQDGAAQLRTYEEGLLKLLTESGGGDLLVMTVDGGSAPPSPRGAPASPRGAPIMPAELDQLKSSAERASKVIDEHISAANSVRTSRESRRSASVRSPPRGANPDPNPNPHPHPHPDPNLALTR